MLTDPGHFHSCVQLKRGTLLRHDLILKLLAKFFRSIGAIVRVEPRVYANDERKIPDLDILLPDRSFFVDVAITHPNSPSRDSARPLAAAQALEAHKAWKYRSISEARGQPVLGFVLESYGAFGKNAQMIVRILRQAASAAAYASLPANTLAVFAVQALAVALQKGNALIARTGSQRARGAVQSAG